MGFVRKVYGILTAQLLLTVVVAAPICAASKSWVSDHQWMLYISLGLMLVTMCSMICCIQQLRTFPTNYIFLFVLTGVMSVVVGFSSAMYTLQSVVLAAGITMLIFLAMTLYACFTKTDFTGMGPYLTAALWTLIIFGFVLSIMSFIVRIDWLVMLYDFLGVLLFTFYIVYDTQLILGEGHRFQFGVDDYVFAALTLYMDIINLFLHLLALLGKRR